MLEAGSAVIALLGNLARDVFPGEETRTGGAPYHAARALARLEVDGTLYARCADADRDELLPPLLALGSPVEYVPGSATASFRIDEDGEHREIEVLSLGEPWLPGDVPALPSEAHWVHVAPLLRGDFPAETLAKLAAHHRVSLDGQGLVRPARLGRLVLDADYDPELLSSTWVLKLSDEEADVLGDIEGLGVPELLVTHGAAGATLYWGGRFDEIEAVGVGGNHTGTGDAFSVAYLAARSQELPPPRAARAAAALVTSMLSSA